MYWAQYPNWYEAHNAFGVTATGDEVGAGRGPRGRARAATRPTSCWRTRATTAGDGDRDVPARGRPAAHRADLHGARDEPVQRGARRGPTAWADERFGALIASTVADRRGAGDVLATRRRSRACSGRPAPTPPGPPSPEKGARPFLRLGHLQKGPGPFSWFQRGRTRRSSRASLNVGEASTSRNWASSFAM